MLGRNVSMLMPDDIARVHQTYIDRYLASGDFAQGRAVGKNRKVCFHCFVLLTRVGS